jgi:hypothetical protein
MIAHACATFETFVCVTPRLDPHDRSKPLFRCAVCRLRPARTLVFTWVKARGPDSALPIITLGWVVFVAPGCSLRSTEPRCGQPQLAARRGHLRVARQKVNRTSPCLWSPEARRRGGRKEHRRTEISVPSVLNPAFTEVRTRPYRPGRPYHSCPVGPVLDPGRTRSPFWPPAPPFGPNPE